MNILKTIAGLEKSTKITIIACASFLALTAVILAFLMIFPITPKHQQSLEQPPVQTMTVSEETQPSSEAWQNTEAPHTLSTWAATFENHTRSSNEYWEYLRSTTTRDQWDETSDQTRAPVIETSTDQSGWLETTQSTDFSETGISGMESSEYTQTQTQTETVVIPPSTDEPPVDPPTDPPQVEDPPVIDPIPANQEAPAAA